MKNSEKIVILLSFFLLFILSFHFSRNVLIFLFYGFVSSVRLLITLFIATIVALLVGVLFLHSEKFASLSVPLFDFLQSLPIVSFFPFVILFFASIPLIGFELSSILLSFTAVAWSLIFAGIEGAKRFGKKYKEILCLMQIEKGHYILDVLFPYLMNYIAPSFVLSLASGWFFIIASEIFGYSHLSFSVPGIGSYMMKMAENGDVEGMLLCFLSLVLFSSLTYSVVLKPLVSHFRKRRAFYTYSHNVISENLLTIFSFLKEKAKPLMDIFASLFSISPYNLATYKPLRFRYQVIPLLLAIAVFSFYDLNFLFKLFFSTLYTLKRIALALVIAFLWTFLFSLLFARKKIVEELLPIFEILMSVPSIIFLPPLLSLLEKGLIDLELLSVILLLTGSQWYLLFLLVRGMRDIERDYFYLARLLQFSPLTFLFVIILPKIFPSAVFGFLQASGGAWNTIIVSEQVEYKGVIYKVAGIGQIIVEAGEKGDTFHFFFALLFLSTTILTINRVVFQPLVRKISL